MLFVWGGQDSLVPPEGKAFVTATLEGVGSRFEWMEANAANAFTRDEGSRYDPALLLQPFEAMLSILQRNLG